MLAAAALEEMREALQLDDAALYLPDADGQPVLRRYVGTSARRGAVLRRGGVAARDRRRRADRPARARQLAGREPVHAARARLGDPAAGHGREMVGVVLASATAPIRIDPLSGTVLSLLGLQLSAGITTARLRRELLRAAMERERRTLAAEVHDGLAQYLAVARRELAREEPDRERLTEAVDSAHRLVRAPPAGAAPPTRPSTCATRSRPRPSAARPRSRSAGRARRGRKRSRSPPGSSPRRSPTPTRTRSARTVKIDYAADRRPARRHDRRRRSRL